MCVLLFLPAFGVYCCCRSRPLDCRWTLSLLVCSELTKAKCSCRPSRIKEGHRVRLSFGVVGCHDSTSSSILSFALDLQECFFFLRCTHWQDGVLLTQAVSLGRGSRDADVFYLLFGRATRRVETNFLLPFLLRPSPSWRIFMYTMKYIWPDREGGLRYVLEINTKAINSETATALSHTLCTLLLHTS